MTPVFPLTCIVVYLYIFTVFFLKICQDKKLCFLWIYLCRYKDQSSWSLVHWIFFFSVCKCSDLYFIHSKQTESVKFCDTNVNVYVYELGNWIIFSCVFKENMIFLSGQMAKLLCFTISLNTHTLATHLRAAALS